MVFLGRFFVLGIAEAFLIRPGLFSHSGGASFTASIPDISLSLLRISTKGIALGKIAVTAVPSRHFLGN